MKIGKVARPATEAAYASGEFKDDPKRRSYKTVDGRQRLFGVDMEPLRRRVFERDGYKCQLHIAANCVTKKLRWTAGYWDSGHLEHTNPRSNGGSDDENNCVTSCGPCNMKKASQKGGREWGE